MLNEPRCGDRRRFERRAGRRGERFRARRIGPDVRLLGEFREGRLVRQQASGERGDLPDVLRGIGRRAAGDREVPEIGVPLRVEEDVGRSDVPVRDPLAVGVGER